MANIVEMPKLSDTMTVGTLVKWLKREGDPVKTGDVLAEVETDKATMELESFFDGALLAVFVREGSQVAIGEALCAIGSPGEKVAAPAPKAPQAAPAPAASVSAAAPAVPPGPPRAQAPSPAAVPSPAPVQPQAAPAAAPSREAPVRVRISPLARKLAAEKGVDPAGVAGSGPGGRIVRADIVAASASAVRTPAAAAAASFSKGPLQEDRVVAVSNVRATIARRLLESKTQIPHYYLDVEVDAGPIIELREQLNTALEKEGVKLSVNDFVLKGAAEALRRVPAVNCSWEGSAIRYHSAAHVSFAVAIDDGLITPVIRDAHLKSLFAISSEAKALGKKAKDKKLALEEFTGGTFCVTNLGMMGIDRFCAIINPPNAAILAVGTATRRPVVRGDAIVVGQRMTLTLSGDHRAVDGALGAAYLAALRDLLEKPALLLI
ncbi:MAG: pyruvate dehydrogenase complex dihydrolipoamide acetyltransferase [Opitutaceae bacterium]|jgi:pyruvate dehydrogenase E2 component (dihydrolipoamide acetyltransferase)